MTGWRDHKWRSTDQHCEVCGVAMWDAFDYCFGMSPCPGPPIEMDHDKETGGEIKEAMRHGRF